LKDIFLPVPSYTTVVGDFGDEKVFLLQDGILSEQDFLYDVISPSNSSYSQTDRSPTSSLYNSDYSEQMFQKDIPICDEFSCIVTNAGHVQTGFDICMDDTSNVPESIYPVEVQDKELVFTNNQTSVIVKTNRGEIFNSGPFNTTNCGRNESNTTILSEYINMHGNISGNENTNIPKIITDADDKNMMKDSESDDEEMRNDFDIETLVEECFMQMQASS
jgi:hypothetical protein